MFQMPPYQYPQATYVEPVKPLTMTTVHRRKLHRGPVRARGGSSLSPAIAVILSLLLVGLPQMMMGQIAKGLLLLVSAVVIGALTLGAGAIVVWIIAAIDAAAIASKLESGKKVGDFEFF